MGLGFTDVPLGTSLAPRNQARMLLELMDGYGVADFDLIANDSGTPIAQILMAEARDRVRSALLTNGDVHSNSPSAALLPAIEAARARQLEHLIRTHLQDASFASSEAGLGRICFGDPAHLSGPLMQLYFEQLLSSPVRIKQFQQYGVEFSPNPLPALREALHRYPNRVAMLWGDRDIHFATEWAFWLDGLFLKSQGVEIVEGGKLFFTEEAPERVAAAARRLWRLPG